MASTVLRLRFSSSGGRPVGPGPTSGRSRSLRREWVDAPRISYVPVDGELEILPGVRLLPAPGHTDGSQIVAIGTDPGPIVIAGDTAVWFGHLDNPETDGQRLIRTLDPEQVWLAHASEPWQPGS